MCSVDYPVTRKVILDKLEKSTTFRDNISGKVWIYGFLKIQPELSDRRSWHYAKNGKLQQNIIDWFDVLNLVALLQSLKNMY